MDELDLDAASYDTVAERYAEAFGAELAAKPVDRVLYAGFAALVGRGARVGDVGCGPGHVTHHVPAAGRPPAYAELARVISPAGWLLVSFHVSTEDVSPGGVRHLDEWWGQAVDLDFHFPDPTEVEEGLAAAGFTTMARTERGPIPEAEAPSHRCHLLAQRKA